MTYELPILTRAMSTHMTHSLNGGANIDASPHKLGIPLVQRGPWSLHTFSMGCRSCTPPPLPLPPTRKPSCNAASLCIHLGPGAGQSVEATHQYSVGIMLGRCHAALGICQNSPNPPQQCPKAYPTPHALHTQQHFAVSQVDSLARHLGAPLCMHRPQADSLVRHFKWRVGQGSPCPWGCCIGHEALPIASQTRTTTL